MGRTKGNSLQLPRAARSDLQVVDVRRSARVLLKLRTEISTATSRLADGHLEFFARGPIWRLSSGERACSSCGQPVICAGCGTCDRHCLQGDAVACGLLTIVAVAQLEDERVRQAIEELAWAVGAQRGLGREAAIAAAATLLRDGPRPA